MLTLLFFIFFGISSSWATDFRLTQCLGREEKLIHLGMGQQQYAELNRELISLVLQSGRMRLNEQVLNEICAPHHESVSYQFLKALLIDGVEIFENSLKDPKMRKLEREKLQVLLRKKLPHLFNIFMVAIKSESPYARCLEDQISFLSQLFLELKHLKDHLSFMEIINKDNRAKKLFQKLEKKEKIYQNCLNASGLNATEKKK